MGDFSIGSNVWPGLSKLIEECGEVIQVCGKLIATGGAEQHWDGSNLRDRLVEELGDLDAAITFVAQECDLDLPSFAIRSWEKFERFQAWHGSQPAAPVTPSAPEDEGTEDGA